MKSMNRAMQSFVYLLWEVAYESGAQNILEIGGGQMQSGRVFLSGLMEKREGMLTTIDLKDRTHRLAKEMLPYFRMIVGNSHNNETLKKVSDRKYDILLIDGDHSYEGVKRDFEMYAPLIKEKGIIFLHDICNINAGVRIFWEEIDYPKVGLEYGKAAGGIIPGMGIVQKIER